MKLYRHLPFRSGIHCSTVFLVVLLQFLFLWHQLKSNISTPGPSLRRSLTVRVPDETHAFLERSADGIAAQYHAQLLAAQGDPEHKVIIFDCLEQGKCYGLGDRLRGISTLFYLSVLTGSSFFINAPIPYPLENFMVPRLHDWRINGNNETGKDTRKACTWTEGLEGRPQTPFDEVDEPNPDPAQVDFVGRNLLKQSGMRSLQDTQFWDWLIQWPQRLWKVDVETFDAKQELSGKRLHRFICNLGYPQAYLTNEHLQTAVQSYHMDQLPQHYLFPIALRVLFKPSPCVQAEMDQYVSRFPDWHDPETIKIGVQVRTYVMEGAPVIDGFLTGHIQPPPLECYEDLMFDIIRDEFRRRTQSMNELDKWDVRSQLRERVIVFVTSDNQQAIDYLNTNLFQFGIRSFSTKHLPSHILESTTVEAAAKTYIDWWLLTQMDRLLITKSTFGETAAAYSLRPTVVVDGWVDSCRTWKFNNTFHSDG
jgi:hypothetical protein